MHARAEACTILVQVVCVQRGRFSQLLHVFRSCSCILVSQAMNFSRAEVGGVMGGGKNTYGDYCQVTMSQWNAFPGHDSHVYNKLVSRVHVC